jgi:hypothetical protein
MKAILALLFMCSAASAQTTWTTTIPSDASSCCANGSCWMERGNICHSYPAARNEIMIQGNGMIASTNATTTNTPQPKCEEGWTLVADLALRPMCARQLKEPR